jgi:predicted DCC family thiol-disulfide oxidoreductase YuxK
MSAGETVFVSYSHKDKRLFDEFRTMLAPAVRNGTLDIWSDARIEAGQRWKEEIDANLATASVAVLLVSPSFLASDFIAKHELPPLLQRAEDEGLVVFWIYLTSCLYEQTEIKGYQAAHDISRPLDALPKAARQALWSEICAKLVRVGRCSANSAVPASSGIPLRPTGTIKQKEKTVREPPTFSPTGPTQTAEVPAYEQHWLFWDKDCGFCKTWAEFFDSRNTRGLFRLVPYQDAPYPPMTPELREECKEAVHVVLRDGSILRGGAACLFALREVGYNIPEALTRSPLNLMTEGAYKLVARNRKLFSKFFTPKLFG